MIDREKVIDNLECISVSCKNRKNIKAYDEIDREMYADWEEIIENSLELLKVQQETIDNLNETVRNLLQHIEDIRQYMTPIGRVEDVKAFVESRPQIVRCKDCKKRESWECWQYFFGRIKIPDDWFCADGVKRKCGE